MIDIKKIVILMVCIFLIGCAKSPVIENPSKISRNDLHFFNNRTQIDIDNYVWIYFNNSVTDSMYPTITKNSHAIGLEVADDTQINIGDIVFFRAPAVKNNYVHRVVEKGLDENGEYFITKGDNNLLKDDFKLRKEHISYIVGAIIY